MPHTSTAEMAEKRPKTFAEIGLEAKHREQRRVLLRALKRNRWNFTATSAELGMGSHANVLRAIRTLRLDAEYESAKAEGLIGPGSRIARAA